MCRSATIHGRSPSGSVECRARRRVGQRGVDRLELARDGGEVLLHWPRRATLRPRARGSASSSARRAVAAAASSGWRSTPRGWAIAHPGGGGLERHARAGRRRRARRSPRRSASPHATRASRAVRTCTRAARSRGIAGRPISGRVRSRTTSQPGRSRSACSTPRATTRSFGRSSTTIVLRLLGRGEQRRVDAGRERGDSRPGTAPRLLREPSRSARSARRAGRAASRAASARADSRAGSATRTSRPRVRRLSRSARYESDGNPGSNPCTTSNWPCASASARFARTPTGTPICDRREIGTAGPTAITSASLASRERATAREQVAAARRRREHGHLVAEVAKSARDAGDVVVDVVRLRPGERRDQADPHRSRIGVAGTALASPAGIQENPARPQRRGD